MTNTLSLIHEETTQASTFLQNVWAYQLFAVSDHSVTVEKFVTAIIAVMISYGLAMYFKYLLRRRLSARGKLTDHAITVLDRSIFFMVLFFGIMTALRIIHIPLSAFAFMGGAAAVGIGFGAKELINNLISGFILMFEKPIKIGDVVEVEDEIGVIADIGLRCTRIHTEDNMDIMLPNSTFLESKIINWTRSTQLILTKIKIGIGYNSDIHKATKIMIDAVKQCDDILNAPEPFVLFKEHGKSTLNFDVYFSIKVHNKMERWMTESHVTYALNDALRAANISIAYPQCDVHLTTAHPLPVSIEKE